MPLSANEHDCQHPPGERGIAELWLLTIDADAFFATSGFSVRGRDDAPSAVRASQEFSSLCPDNAVLMSKTTGRV